MLCVVFCRETRGHRRGDRVTQGPELWKWRDIQHWTILAKHWATQNFGKSPHMVNNTGFSYMLPKFVRYVFLFVNATTLMKILSETWAMFKFFSARTTLDGHLNYCQLCRSISAHGGGSIETIHKAMKARQLFVRHTFLYDITECERTWLE